MPTQARVVWDQSFTGYNFGPAIPMDPLRLDLTARLCEALGRLRRTRASRWSTRRCPDDELLLTVHDADYVAAVRAASADPAAADHGRGLGTEDDPAFVGMHEASARIAAGTRRRRRAPSGSGEAAHGVNFCGGLHHAMPGNACGLLRLQRRRRRDPAGCSTTAPQRVAYVDVDVHHGDGVERIFWDDPRVLTISLHESGRMLFPGTGLRRGHRRTRAREGSAVNVALPPGTGDAGVAARPPRRGAGRCVRAFAPDVLVTQHGCDTHFLDPLAHLAAVRGRPAGRRTTRCTTWPTRSAAAGGSPSAAAATSSSTSCRAPGRT